MVFMLSGVVVAGLVFAAGADTPAVTNAVIQRGLSRVGVISAEVATIRGLEFKKKVQADVQSIAAFRAKVRKEISEQYGEDGGDAYVRALLKLGSLKKPVKLTAMALALLEEQAAAHYDTDDNMYHLLSTNVTAFGLDLISSHELCHALQDQHFDLHEFAEKDIEAIRDNADAIAAKQCLIEGEATLVMMVWMLMKEAETLSVEMATEMASVAVMVQASIDVDTLIALSEQQAKTMESRMGSMAGSAEDLRKYPRFFVEQLLAAYIQGAVFVDRVRGEHGWPGVSDMYKLPPQSTEQILHPEKYLAAERDEPIDVRLRGVAEKLPRGWVLREEDVLGEMGLQVLFKIWPAEAAVDIEAAESAAAGWGGDRYYYFEKKDDPKENLLVWQTVWDTRRDALEFSAAYRALLLDRFPSAQKHARSGAKSAVRFQVWEVTPARFLKLAVQDKVVNIVDTTDVSLLGLPLR